MNPYVDRFIDIIPHFPHKGKKNCLCLTVMLKMRRQIFVRLDRNSAGILMYVKEFLCKRLLLFFRLFKVYIKKF